MQPCQQPCLSYIIHTLEILEATATETFKPLPVFLPPSTTLNPNITLIISDKNNSVVHVNNQVQRYA